MLVSELYLPESRSIVIEKRLSSRDTAEPEAVSRLRHEAFLLRVLDGSVAPRLLASGEDARGPWLRMEKIAFPTLLERIERSAPETSSLAWLRQAARSAFEALATLHEASDGAGPLRIVHADISPANLVIEDNAARALLLDLGLAHSRQAPPRDGAFRGTVGYCATEIARGEVPTAASDIFSLAASLIHAATGHIPRTGPSLAVVLSMAAEHSLLDSPQIADAARTLGLTECLAFDSSDRPASARDVLELLRGRGQAP